MSIFTLPRVNVSSVKTERRDDALLFLLLIYGLGAVVPATDCKAA